MVRFRGFFSKHKTGSLFLGLVIASLITLGVSTKAINFKPKQVGQSFFSVFQLAIYEVGDFFRSTVTSIRELRQLRADYDALQKKINEYRFVERDIVSLQQEIDRLNELLGFSNKLEIEHIPAEIIAKDPGNFFNTITLNKGSTHGVKPDMPVIALQDEFEGLVGKIVNVGLFTSELIPIYDRNCFVAARLQNTRYEGLVAGQGNSSGFLKMRYVKKISRTEIGYGDLVITSGMTSIYPRGIYIGRIRNISARDYETSLELELEPIIDFSKLEHVFILQADKN